jgi:hypothetical protein
VIQGGLEPDEARYEPPTVTALLALLNQEHDSAPVTPAPGWRQGRKRAAFAGAAIGMLLSAGTAAAATGHLPGAIQEVAHQVAAELGISIPGPAATADKGNPGGERTCEHTSATMAGTSVVLSCEGPDGVANAWGAPQPFNPEPRAALQARKPARVVSTQVAPSRLSTSVAATTQQSESAVFTLGRSASPPGNQGRGPTGAQAGKSGSTRTPRSGGPQGGTTTSPRRAERQAHSRSQPPSRNTGNGRVSGHDSRRQAPLHARRPRPIPPGAAAKSGPRRV